MKKLCIHYDGSQKPLQADGKNLTIGSSSKGNWIVINGPGIPDIVARLYWTDGRWRVKSMNSGWQIRCDGKDHNDLLLEEGTIFSIGGYHFEVKRDEEIASPRKETSKPPVGSIPPIPPGETLKPFFTRPIYKLGLVGGSESGKTCLLAALSMPRSPSKVAVLRHQKLKITPAATNLSKKDRDRLVGEFEIGQEKLDKAIAKLEKGDVPLPTGAAEAESEKDSAEYRHSRYVFEFSGGGRIVEIEDYSGEFVNPGLANEAKAQRILKMLNGVHGLFVLCETPRAETDLIHLNDSLSRLINFLAVLAELDHALPVTVLVNKWDRRRDLTAADFSVERVHLQEFLNSNAPESQAINNCIKILREKLGEENVDVAPLSALGPCEVTRGKAETMIEHPRETQPLRSFHLEEAFVDMLDRIDKRSADSLEARATRLPGHPWLPLWPTCLGGSAMRDDARSLRDEANQLQYRGVKDSRLDRIRAVIKWQLDWANRAWASAGVFSLLVLLGILFSGQSSSQLRQLEASLRAEIEDAPVAAVTDIVDLTNRVISEAGSLESRRVEILLRSLRPDYQDFLLRYINEPLSNGVGHRRSLDPRIEQVDAGRRHLERRLADSRGWQQDLCVAAMHLERAANDFALYEEIRRRMGPLQPMAAAYPANPGIPRFMKNSIDQRLTNPEQTVLYLTDFHSDRDFREIHLSGRVFSGNAESNKATLTEDLSGVEFPAEIRLAEFRASPGEELGFTLELETRPELLDPRNWGRSMFIGEPLQLVVAQERELVLLRKDGRDERVRVRYRLDQSHGVLPPWRGHYTRFGFMREDAPLRCSD